MMSSVSGSSLDRLRHTCPMRRQEQRVFGRSWNFLNTGRNCSRAIRKTEPLSPPFPFHTANRCVREVLSETVGSIQATQPGTMATALQQQLAQIAKKSTDQLDLKAQRAQHSKSLLFDPRVASNQTFETIYQICAEAFQELCMLDARFAPFAANLFSEQSKSEERINLTKKENEHLDHIIDSFLGLVSSRLLLRPGLKAVEWLVRRFRYVPATPTAPSGSNANLTTVSTNITPSLLSSHSSHTTRTLSSPLCSPYSPRRFLRP